MELFNDFTNNQLQIINKQYNTNLDYTMESINEVMSIIDSAKVLFERNEINSVYVDDLITTLGTYIGDILLKNGFAKIGFSWTNLEEINNEALTSFFHHENLKGPFVACIKGILTPIDKVRKYWNNGQEDDLSSYCRIAIRYLKVELNNNENNNRLKILM